MDCSEGRRTVIGIYYAQRWGSHCSNPFFHHIIIFHHENTKMFSKSFQCCPYSIYLIRLFIFSKVKQSLTEICFIVIKEAKMRQMRGFEQGLICFSRNLKNMQTTSGISSSESVELKLSICSFMLTACIFNQDRKTKIALRR